MDQMCQYFVKKKGRTLLHAGLGAQQGQQRNQLKNFFPPICPDPALNHRPDPGPLGKEEANHSSINTD